MVVLVVIQTVVLALLGLLVVSLLRSHAAILRRLHEAGYGVEDDEAPAGAPPGPVAVPLRTRPGVPEPGPGAEQVVDVVGTTPAGSTVSISVTGQRPTLLAFLSSGCSTCDRFWEAFREGLPLPGDLRLVVVTRGDDAEDRAAIARLAPRDVTVVLSSAAWRDYAVPASPYFVLVGAGRVLGEGSALQWDQVGGLLERALFAVPDPPRRPRRQHDRIQDTDEELRSAGITPGDPSLYPDPLHPVAEAGLDHR